LMLLPLLPLREQRRQEYLEVLDTSRLRTPISCR